MVDIDNPDPWLVLLDIDLGNGVVLYLVNNNEDITFNTQLYTAFAFNIVLPKENGRGEIPSVELSVSNTTRAIQTYIEQYAGGVGATVTLRVVHADNLAEDYTELTMILDVLATKSTAQYVSFTLGAPNPMRQRFPQHQYIALSCMWIYKGAECGYAGAIATCGRTWAECELHNNTGKFGGFPGLNNIGLRLV